MEDRSRFRSLSSYLSLYKNQNHKRSLSHNSIFISKRKNYVPKSKKIAKFRYLFFQIVFNSLPSVLLVFIFILGLYYILYPIISKSLMNIGHNLYGIDLVVIFASFRFFFFIRSIASESKLTKRNIIKIILVEIFSLSLFALNSLLILPYSIKQINTDDKIIRWGLFIAFSCIIFPIPELLSNILDNKLRNQDDQDEEKGMIQEKLFIEKSIKENIWKFFHLLIFPILFVSFITLLAAFFFTLPNILENMHLVNQKNHWYFSILVYGIISPLIKFGVTYILSINYFKKAYLSSKSVKSLQYNDRQFILTIFYQSTAFGLVNKIILYSVSADKSLLDFVIGLILSNLVMKLASWIIFITFQFIKKVKNDFKRENNNNKRTSRSFLSLLWEETNSEEEENPDLLDLILQSETLTFDMSIARFCYGMISEYIADILTFLIFLFFPIITNVSQPQQYWQMSNMNLFIRFICSLIVSIAGDSLILGVNETFDIMVIDIDLPLISHFLNCGIMAALVGIYICSSIHGFLTF